MIKQLGMFIIYGVVTLVPTFVFAYFIFCGVVASLNTSAIAYLIASISVIFNGFLIFQYFTKIFNKIKAKTDKGNAKMDAEEHIRDGWKTLKEGTIDSAPKF